MKTKNKKIEYVNPETFTVKINEFDEFHYDIVKSISDCLKKKYKSTKTDVTDILSNYNGDELIMGVIKERDISDATYLLKPLTVAEKYKIIIKKI